MASLINIPVYTDERGSLAVIQEICPFPIKRIFHIHNVPRNEVRGKHGHIDNRIILTAVSGSCSVFYNNGIDQENIILESPSLALLLEPEDWHSLSNFSGDCVLLAMCSEQYSKDDYFFEEPND